MTPSETPFPETDLATVETLSATMERTAPLTEIQVFRLKQAASEMVRESFHSKKPMHFDSNSKFREINDRYSKDPNFWENRKYLCEAAKGSFQDRLTLGRGLNLPVMAKLTSILRQSGFHELARRFDVAAKRHHCPIRRPIRHLIEDGRLNGLQACAPRLRVIFKGVVSVDGVTYADYDTVCEECGGSDLSMPDGVSPSGPVICAACDHVLGSRSAVEKLARYFSSVAMQNPLFGTAPKG